MEEAGQGRGQARAIWWRSTHREQSVRVLIAPLKAPARPAQRHRRGRMPKQRYPWAPQSSSGPPDALRGSHPQQHRHQPLLLLALARRPSPEMGRRSLLCATPERPRAALAPACVSRVRNGRLSSPPFRIRAPLCQVRSIRDRVSATSYAQGSPFIHPKLTQPVHAARMDPATKALNRVLPFVPPFYPDETVYSFLARCQHLRGHSVREFNKLVFGRLYYVSLSGMPSGLDRVASLFVNPAISAEYIARKHTLLPFHTAFHLVTDRLRFLAAMCGDAGANVGSVPQDPFDTRKGFRFCLVCHEQMTEKHGTLYWKRIHQIPIVTICPDHDVPLRFSSAPWSRRDYYQPTEDNCPADAPTLLDGNKSVDHDLLRHLAESARDLLENDDLQVERPDPRISLVMTLKAKGYTDPADGVSWKLLRPIVDDIINRLPAIYPKITSTTKPSRTVPSWLSRHRHVGERAVAATTLLAQRIADEAPTIPLPFGKGPWECINPVSDHRGAKVIQAIDWDIAVQGGRRAMLRCECGFAYTLQTKDGSIGKPRFSKFGPLLAKVIVNARARDMSLWQTAESVGLTVVALLNAMERENIPIHWRKLPSAFREQSAKKRARSAGAG